MREEANSDRKSFDIKTVQNCMQLTGPTSYAVTLMVDLKERTLTYLDLYVTGAQAANTMAEGSQNVRVLAKEVNDMLNTRPQMLALAEYHLRARGGIRVESADAADITIGVRDCDFNALQVAQVLEELL